MPAGSGRTRAISARSLQRNLRLADHLAPARRFLDHARLELRGRDRRRLAAELDDAGLDLRVGESGVDLLVEGGDDLGRRGLRRADALPSADLEARHGFA